jgi:DNA-binding transcriptional ArsR family regulator
MMLIWEYNISMPRAPTTSDAFNALAERRRRDIIDLLSHRENRPVGELVNSLRIPQPAVSKHLRVLRKVGLVNVRRQGRNRFYSLNARPLKPVHDWVKTFERFWDDHLDAIKALAERKARERALTKNESNDQKK